MGHRFTRTDVVDGRGSGRRARCGDGDFDRVSGGDGDAAKIVGVIWVPFVPRVIRVGRAGSRPVNAGLQNGSFARVAVNADPGRAGTGGGWRWDCESSGYAFEAGSDENGAGPVGTVFNVGIVGFYAGWGVNVEEGVALAVNGPSSVALSSDGGSWGSNGAARKQKSAGEGEELHVSCSIIGLSSVKLEKRCQLSSEG